MINLSLILFFFFLYKVLRIFYLRFFIGKPTLTLLQIFDCSACYETVKAPLLNVIIRREIIAGCSNYDETGWK